MRRTAGASSLLARGVSLALAGLVVGGFPRVAQSETGGPADGSASTKQTESPAAECVLPRYWNLKEAATFDTPEGFRCLLATAEKGDAHAIEWAQALLWEGTVAIGNEKFGGLFPRSESRLKRYIEMGASRGSHYSMLAKAAYLQDVDPATALGLYRQVAIADDCRGQAMLSWMYLHGVGVEPNAAKAYFWGRLAARNRTILFREGGSDGGFISQRPVPYFENRVHALRTGNPNAEWKHKHDCRNLNGDLGSPLVDIKSMQSTGFAEEVHDLLLVWARGEDTPDQLDRFAGLWPERLQNPSKEPEAVRRTRSDIVSRVAWRPISGRFAPPSTTGRSPANLYDELSKSVYVIVAAATTGDLRAQKNVAQGSAVAVDVNALITNCHIVRGRPKVFLASRRGLLPLKVTSANLSADTCILSIEAEEVVPVPRVRRFGALQVGEPVIAIGSPSGFANTLSAGIISQVRRVDGRRVVQTNAQISAGSSGGGLFDMKGNLIGITTFGIRDAEGLNFALAIDEYLQ